MTTSDWIIDTLLLLIVVRQLRESRVTARTFVVPLVLIGWAASTYLRAVPTAGNDLVLIGGFGAVGVILGLLGGLLTRVRSADGHTLVKATAGAAVLWLLSMGFRFAFAVWSSHPSGAAHLTRFSVAHDITSSQAWVAALILMACGEVVVRMGTIAARSRLLATRSCDVVETAGRTAVYS